MTRHECDQLVNIFAQSVAETGPMAFSTTSTELHQPNSFVLDANKHNIKPLAHTTSGDTKDVILRFYLTIQ